MGLVNFISSRLFSLTTQDRQSIWKQFGSFKANQFAMSGTSMIDNSYEKNVDVYSVIKKIVDITKSVDWIVEEKKGGEWVLLEATSLHELMAAPNVSKGYTWNDIEEMMLVYLLSSGNTYMVGNTQFERTLIEEVDILPSYAVCIELKSGNFFMPEIEYEFEIDNREYEFTKEQIAHVKFFNPTFSTTEESLYGLSPIQVAAKVVQTGNDRWEADANILQNRGAIGMITDASNRPMSPEEADKVQQDFNRRTGGIHNQGSVKVTNKDLKYIQMAMSSTDLQLIEKGVVNLRAICSIFGVDSSLFNDPENKTYNNRREAEKALYTNAIMPISDKLAEALTYFLCRNHFPNQEVRMRQDFSKIESLQENFQEKATTITTLKNAGIITANDAARALKLPESSDPNADKLIISNNQVLLSNLTKEPNATGTTN